MFTLERMQVQGFKSFHDRTEIVLDKQVTAVVGPNGCGKSNIVDAISWVLGEQSVKSLRGARMQDLIFSGSERFKPVGMAEVSLSLKSVEDSLPNGMSQASITRRLHRSGDSEYLLNGVPCRLKDIQDLLYGTGIGVKAYSFIEQGKIGSILGAKPHERRALIEEAAGITRFRARRREAELKLQAAQSNLVRVQDILRELESRMGSLKRQASKARRYQQLRERLKQTLSRLYAVEYHRLVVGEREIVARLTRATDLRTRLSTEVSSLEAELEQLRLKVEKAEASLAGAQRSLHELGLETDRTRGAIGHARDRLHEEQHRLERLAEQQQSAEQTRQLVVQAREAAEQALLRGEQSLEAAVAGCEQARHSHGQALQQLADGDARLEQQRAAELELVRRAAELRHAIEGRRRLLEQHQARLERLEVETHRVEGERQTLETRGVELALALADAEARQRSTQQRLQQAQQLVGGARVARDEAQAGMQAAAQRHAQLSERLRALDELVERGRDLGSATEHALRELGPAAGGVLADQLRVEQRLERAVEAVLSDSLGALLLADSGLAEQLLDNTQLAEQGRLALLLEATPAADTPALELPQSAAVLGPLAELVDCAPEHRERLRALIADVLVVEDLEVAHQLWSAGTAWRLVTLRGELLDRRGLWLSAGKDGEGVLALRRERRELAGQLDAHAAVLTQAEQRLERCQQELAAGKQSCESLSAELHAAEREALPLGRDLEANQQQLARVQRGLEALGLERESVHADHSRIDSELTQAAEQLTTHESEHQRLEQSLRELQAAREQHRQDVAGRQQQLTSAEANQARAEEALKTLANELESVMTRLGESEQRLRQLRLEQEQGQQRCGELQQQIEQSEAKLEGLLGDTASLEQRIADEQAGVSRLRHGLIEREAVLKERRVEAEQQLERVQQVMIERTRMEGELTRLSERCREELELEPQSLSLADALTEGEPSAEQGAAPDTPEPQAEVSQQTVEAEASGDPEAAGATPAAAAEPSDTAVEVPEGLLEELRQRADGLRHKLQRLGPVNVLAIDEYEELSQRFEFLSSQSNDLTASIDSLNQTIARINRTSRERFRTAFEAVNRYFAEVFTLLFRGGRAELRLTDAEDVLECGIDIVAQPPGKRLQNIMLLSGGEKALTALSLLFALFRYKPSPFCVLDEVDAPLDESNIDRFVKLLKELHSDTQFVIVTHSPTTMKSADVLYGVTMQEPGVSQLVGVSFEQIEASA